MSIPTLLRHVLLVISFNWNVQKLIYLKSVRCFLRRVGALQCIDSVYFRGKTSNDMQVLHNAQQYKTSVTIHVVCNEAAALRNVIHTWDCPLAVSVHQSQNLDNDTRTYNLLWEHREVMQAAALSGASLHASQSNLISQRQRNGTGALLSRHKALSIQLFSNGATSFWLSVNN